MESKKDRPSCFAQIDKVFPMRADGFRKSPETCLRCEHKTICLRTAMRQRNGLSVREEMIDRAYRGGMIGFFQRWSQKKAIHRQKKP